MSVSLRASWDQIVLLWQPALTRPASVSHSMNSERKMHLLHTHMHLGWSVHASGPVLHAWPGWAGEEKRGDEGFLPCLRMGNRWSLLLMHESGLQGHPGGCPALVKASTSGHSSLLYDVKSTDLCYGYQSELTFTKGGAS